MPWVHPRDMNAATLLLERDPEGGRNVDWYVGDGEPSVELVEVEFDTYPDDVAREPEPPSAYTAKPSIFPTYFGWDGHAWSRLTDDSFRATACTDRVPASVQCGRGRVPLRRCDGTLSSMEALAKAAVAAMASTFADQAGVVQ